MEHRRRRGFIDGAPALAIEIVSPDSVDRDYVRMLAIYEEAGVAE
jgi:Uma2 family endonuclease